MKRIHASFDSKGAEMDSYDRYIIVKDKDLSILEAYEKVIDTHLKDILEAEYGISLVPFNTDLLKSIMNSDLSAFSEDSSGPISIGMDDEDEFVYADIQVGGKKTRSIREITLYRGRYNKFEAMWLSVDIVDVSANYKTFQKMSKDELIELLLLHI